jgi:transcriptional regulator with XRE-family HTH domain
MHDRAIRLRRNVLRWRAKGWTVARIAARAGVTPRWVNYLLAEARREVEDRQRAG